jgi:hypothetical protein
VTSVGTWCYLRSQLLARGVALLLHGYMVAWSVLLLDEHNIDSLSSARINYMCFISFLFVVGNYIKYKPIYIYNTSQWSNFLCPGSRANKLARAFERAESSLVFSSSRANELALAFKRAKSSSVFSSVP